MTDHNTFTFKDFRKIRHGYIDVLREGQRKRFIHGLFEVDVTDVRLRLGEYKTRTGETPSFTAFVIHCLGKAVDENKILHVMRQGRNKLVLFDEVDVSTQIEVEVDGHKIVKPRRLAQLSASAIACSVVIVAPFDHASPYATSLR